MLKREEVENKIEEFDAWEIIKIAYENWIPGFGHGITAIDIRDGEVFGMTRSQGEYSMDDKYFIFLYKIEANQEFSDDELLNEEEFEEFDNGDYNDIEEYAKEKGIDLAERELNFFEYYYNEDYADIQRNIENQLDEIYGKQ